MTEATNPEIVNSSAKAAVSGLPSPAAPDPDVRPLVFVSYRVSPDEPAAAALKEFVESSLEPSPDVFVSGVGGLRPSSIGFKPQLQAAVQRASAFLAMITPASKDREWIFFEAGAAWGRGQLYAPILFGTTPGDLPSAIADYQAVPFDSKDKMRQLLQELAVATGASVKGRFGIRFEAFSRRLHGLRDAKQHDPWDDSGENEGDTELKHAFVLARSGETERSLQLYDSLERQAASDDERAKIALSRISALTDNRQTILRKVDALPSDLRSSYRYFEYRGMLDPNPATAVRNLREAVSRAPSLDEQERLSIRLGYELLRCGRRQDAQTCLFPTLLSDNSLRRAEAAAALDEVLKPGFSTARLLILVSSLGHPTAGTLYALTVLSQQNRFSLLFLYFSSWYEEFVDGGSAANLQGIAFEALGLPNAAFEAYSRSSEAGVLVAKANIARLLMSSPNSEAACQILADLPAKTDAAAPYYPHELRVQVEKNLHQEQEKVKTYLDRAREFCSHLQEFSENVLTHLQDSLCAPGNYRIVAPDGDEVSFSLSSGGVSSCVSRRYGVALSMELLAPFDNVFMVSFAGAGALLCVANSSKFGLMYDNLSDNGFVLWLGEPS